MDSSPLTRKLVIFIELFVGLTALVGGAILIASPSGDTLGFSADWLNTSPFPNYLVPGIVLFFAIGGEALAAAFLTYRRHPAAVILGASSGLTLLVWICLQLFWIGYRHPLQPLYAVLGLIVFQASLILLMRQKSSSSKTRVS